MIGNLHDGVKHKKYIGHTAAGTDGSAVASSALATAGFDRVRVCIELGTVTSGGVIEASISGCATASGDFVDIVSLGDSGYTATGKSEGTIILDCPLGNGAEFIKVNYKRKTANIELDGITLDFYSTDVVPVVQDSSVAKIVAV